MQRYKPRALSEQQAALMIGQIINGNLPPLRILHCDRTLFKEDLRLCDIFLAMRTLAVSHHLRIISASDILGHLKSEVWLYGNNQRIEDYAKLLARLQATAKFIEMRNGE